MDILNNEEREFKGTVLKVGPSPSYYALIECGPGTRVKVPLYVDRSGGEGAFLKAKELAKRVAEIADKRRVIDVPVLIKEGILPFADYLAERVSKLKESLDGQKDVRHGWTLNGESLKVYFCLQNSMNPIASTVIDLPGAGEPGLRALWEEVLVRELGDKMRKTRMSNPDGRKDHSLDLVDSLPTSVSISPHRDGRLRIYLEWPDKGQIYFNPGTAARDLADNRLRGMLELIETAVKHGGSLPVKELREYLANRSAWSRATAPGGDRGRT